MLSIHVSESLSAILSAARAAAIVHANAEKRARELREQTQHLLPQGEIPVVEINPVIGAHVGPGALGFACLQARNQ